MIGLNDLIDGWGVDAFLLELALSLVRVVEVATVVVRALDLGGSKEAFEGSQHPALEAGVKSLVLENLRYLLLNESHKEALPLVGDLERLVIMIASSPPSIHGGAVITMKVEDFFLKGKRWWVRLEEKGGKHHEMPAHHNLEAYLDAYLNAAGIRGQKKTPLFRSARGKTKTLTENPMARGDVYRMIRRRARDAGTQTPIGCHSFRATGITA
jgi:integrase